MTGSNEPEALLRALGEERVPPEDAAVVAARRERIVAGAARAIRESKSQRERVIRVRRWAALGAVAAAAAFALGFSQHFYRQGSAPAVVARPPAASNLNGGIAGVRSVRGTVVLKHAGRGRLLTAGEVPNLESGDELETAADGFALVQTERSAIRVQAASKMSVLPPSVVEERIRLTLGRIDLKVSKQPHSTRSVVVETPNAEVVVRGTEFMVAVAPERGQPVTQVRVTEGAVWVLHHGERELLGVGEEWSSTRGRLHAASAAVTTPAPVRVEPRPSTKAAARAPKDVRSKAANGSLGEETRLYQAALDARNRGEDRKALELFGGLVARYPNSPLAEPAQVERMRAFKRLGDGGAAQAEARRYLAEHPSGAVRDEARGVVLGEK